MRPAATLPQRLFTLVVSMAFVTLCAGTAAGSQIGFVYALQQVGGGTNQIYGFRFDRGTGALTLLPGFPVASGGTGTSGGASEQLAYLDGRLYVLNDGDNTLTAFSVNRATGALTAMPFSPIALGTGNWNCVAVHPSGSPVVAGNGPAAGAAALASFVVTDTTATAASGSPFSTGSARPFSCRFSQDGSYIYTGNNFGSTIAGFTVNAGTGVLTPIASVAVSPFESGGNNPVAYATDSSGRLFVATTAGPLTQLRAFTTLQGAPTSVSGNPFASGLTLGVHGVLHPSGFYLVADRTGNQVGMYQVTGTGDGTTLTAVNGSPFATGGTATSALALTPDGAYLLAANGTSRNLTVFTINAGPVNGLASVGVQAPNMLGASGIITGLAFAESEAGFVYTLQNVPSGSNQIHGFRINPSTGAMTPLAGFPVASGGTGSNTDHSEQVAYRNGRLYVVNHGNDTLSAFKVNRTTGALTALPFSPISLPSGSWRCVAVHPSGSPVVVGNDAFSEGFLASFNVGATTATAAAGSPFATGAGIPFSCAFSHDGAYVYTGGAFGSRFAGLSVNAGTGVLTPLAGSPFESGGSFPLAYATDTSGRLFSSNASAGHVRVFSTSAGVPSSVSGNPFASGLSVGIHGVRHPSGFYMVADQSGNRVGVYRVSAFNPALAAVTGSPFASGGSSTAVLALTEDGGFLVAAHGTSRNLTVFRVTQDTGALTSVGVQPANTLGASGRITGMAFAPVVPPFIDDPLTAVTPVIKAVHITELRARIDAVRAQYGLGPYAYFDPTLSVGTTLVRGLHIAELRGALAQVYDAVGMKPPGYTDATLFLKVTVVKLAHIMELRAAVIGIE